MKIVSGAQVEHPDFGFGTVQQVVGGVAVVRFFGEDIDVQLNELTAKGEYKAEAVARRNEGNTRKTSFRRAYEAINLGVVPPEPVELIDLTIGGDRASAEVTSWLENAHIKGLCKVVFGNYGTGKSHFLNLVRAIALGAGWVVSYLEFDPKAADPAKPHLVYRGLMNNLHFPKKEDGTQIEGYMGLIKEIRRFWLHVRDIPHFKLSPWFKNGFEALITEPHGDDQVYLDGCDWLFGQNSALQTIRSIARNARLSANSIPNMPRTKETADIYVHHLVVVHEICKVLNFKGLLIILDEAEHVRSYNVRRRSRANNFFDILARTAHPPVLNDEPPIKNDHGFYLPAYWQKGPHFGLCVGLTEGNIFADPTLPLREACVFLHNEDDRIYLTPPYAGEYEELCLKLFSQFNHYYPENTRLLATDDLRRKISSVLRKQYELLGSSENPIRVWVKLACLVPSILFAGKASDLDDLARKVQKAAQEATTYVLPWEI